MKNSESTSQQNGGPLILKNEITYGGRNDDRTYSHNSHRKNDRYEKNNRRGGFDKKDIRGSFDRHDKKDVRNRFNRQNGNDNRHSFSDKNHYSDKHRDEEQKKKSAIPIGKTQELIVVKTTDFGVFLNTPTGEDSDKILLPKSQVPKGTQLNDVLNVFVYKDSEDRPIATMEEPSIELGQVARLYVKEVTKIGAFLDWGLSKDLLLPFNEQAYEVKEDDAVLVTLYVDKSDRLCASMKVYNHLSNESPYKKDDEVFGRVYEISDNFGVFIAVDDKYSALLPKKEVFEKYRINQPVYARVAQVMDDGRLTLSVKKKIPEQMNDDASFIYETLQRENGFLPFNDKSDSEAVKNRFHMSKNAFKRAIGHLYKERLITIEKDGIHLND